METIGEHTLWHLHAPARARTQRPSEEEREREKEEHAAMLLEMEMGVKRMIGFIAVVLPLMLWMSSLGDRVLDQGV